MKILVVGRGGREHAIAWKISQSELVSQIFVAPGSLGIEKSLSGVSCVNIDENDTTGLLDFAIKQHIDLTIIGPEVPLMNGLADEFLKNNLPVFGPIKAAAMIEGSKQFAKLLMQKYNIPTADFATFSDYSAAKNYLDKVGVPIVIKYDGLAAGKGVVVAQTPAEADEALKDMLLENKFGKGKVIIEEFLEGPEFSLMALVNGEQVVPLTIAQDHKRAYDGDLGSNTGGMGAYTPVPIIPRQAINDAFEKIMKPAAKALVNEGASFTGVLYGGLILTHSGPKVIEFNARFGDPETEVVLPKMKSDLIKHILDILAHKTVVPEWHDKAILGVVMASKGYPGKAEKGAQIKGLENIKNTVFHMGTAFKDDSWIANGGRVLFILGEGITLKNARENAYEAVNQIESDGLFYRKDIGWQVIEIGSST